MFEGRGAGEGGSKIAEAALLGSAGDAARGAEPTPEGGQHRAPPLPRISSVERRASSADAGSAAGPMTAASARLVPGLTVL